MNVVMKKEGAGRAFMPEAQKKWSDFPIGAAFPPNGAWKGQPQLTAPARKSPFFRADEPPPAARKAKEYAPSPDRVMF